MDEREAKLPVWAREIIRTLRERIWSMTSPDSPVVREVAELRPQVDLLKRRNGALRELLECAAKGGHVASQDIVSILAGYGLQLGPDED
jgi:hypothetical protein